MAYTVPTPSEVINNAGALGGRVAIMRAEALNLLSLALPPSIEELNTNESISLETPKQWAVSKQVLEENAFPAVVAKTRVMGDPLESPRTRSRIVQLQIFIIAGLASGREQQDDLWDLAELADGVFLKVQDGHCNPDDVKVWSQLEFEGMTDELGEGWNKYEGVVLTYTVRMSGIRGFKPLTI